MNIPNDPRQAFQVAQQARHDLSQRLMDDDGSDEAVLRAARRACREFVDAAGHYGANFAADPEAFAPALTRVREATAGV